VIPDPPVVRLERGVETRLLPLRLADTGGRPRLSTHVVLVDTGDRLVARFRCEDPEPRATLTARDAPLWKEEVVELFVAPGAAAPRRYFELELNPLGAVFDAVVDSPDGDRRSMIVDPSWSCPGLATSVEIDAGRSCWQAKLSLPWRALVEAGPIPLEWRVNLYRVDRPTQGPPEFSAWSVPGVDPPDFHRPDRFGFVTRMG